MKPGDFVEYLESTNMPAKVGRIVEIENQSAHVRFLYGPLWIVRIEDLNPCDLLDAYRAIEEEIKVAESQAASKIDKLRAEARAAFERALTAGRP